MRLDVRKVIVGLLAVAVASCGGGDSFTSSGSSSGGGGSTSSGSGIRIGSGTGASFRQGVLAIGTTTMLSAGGSTTVTATLVDSVGTPYATATDISFASTCSAVGLATLISPVTTSNGVAISTYSALGCAGTDTITATATVDGDTLTATGSVTVAAAALGSIQFVSASPTTIALAGTGGAGLQETSTVTFKVINSSGGPVPNQEVTFALSTNVGGLSVSPATGTTGIDGKVQTVVQAGSVAVPVRVIATTEGANGSMIATLSDQLTVSTGIPVDGGLDVSVSVFNPEAYEIDGQEVTVTANVADRFNNPVPNGTVVNFIAEAGRIQSSCTTTDGACTVTWTSQGQELAQGESNPGATTILAYAVGEERFADVNGNGRFDDGDGFTDLGEAFLDKNWNSTHDSSTDPVVNEPYIDFDQSGAYDAAGDSKFNGVLCQHSTDCSTTTSLIVSDQVRIVMSTSGANITPNKGSLDVRATGSDSITVLVEDENGNIMPARTTVRFRAPSGVEIPGTSSFTVPNRLQLSGTTYTVGLNDGDPAADGAGYLEITVTTPGGTETTLSIPITY